MKFLKYRRDLVSAWPDSRRKAVFLKAIDRRIQSTEQQIRMASQALERRSTAS